MTLREFFYILWGRRWMVLIVTVLALAATAAYTFSEDPSYTAESRVSVVPDQSSLSQAELEAFLESSSTTVASDDEFLAEAVRQSGWQGGVPAFRDGLEPEYYIQSSGSPGIDVRFTAESPEMAVRAANAYAGLLAGRISNLEVQGFTGSLEAEASVESDAEVENVGLGRRPLLHLVLAGLAGLLVSGGAAILLDARTRSWRSARDAEITLHAPVLGTIPDYAVLGLPDGPEDEPRKDTIS